MSGVLPLDGLKVLDLSRLLPGAWCSCLLADLGADVLKIEAPGGDPIRELPPFLGKESTSYLLLHRNKRSMTLNLKHASGKQVLRALAREADILLEGFRPGVMTRLGVGYETLQAENARLVYCAISGYGQDGPYAHLPGHDLNYMGVAGALELFGFYDRPPCVPGLTVADLGGGAQMAVIGILAALAAREKTGRGQSVDISMTDGVVSWLSLMAAYAVGTGESPRRQEHFLLGKYPFYAVYETSDRKHLTVGCLEPSFWTALCHALERPQHIPEQWNDTKRQEIFEDLEAIFRSRTREDWIAFFTDKNVCVAPSLSIAEAHQDKHLRHRGMFTSMLHPDLGEIPQLGIPIKFSATPGTLRTPPPALGQHTDQVLLGLGFSASDIAHFRAHGVV